MNLMYNILLPIYLLLEVCLSTRNFHLPHGGGYHGGGFHHSDMEMQHENNYQHYDSYSSEEVVLRQRQTQRRSKYHRHQEYSDSEYNYKCKCSCTKCQKRKPKPKPCCEEFCATECPAQNNILVVPYPVPYPMQPMPMPPPPMPPMPPITPAPPIPTPPPTKTTTTTTTERPTTVQTTPPPRKTVAPTFSTVPYMDSKHFKRFQIINEMNLRRNMGMGNNGLRSPHKFGRLPKYGIVPIPENLALSLMQQIRKDQSHDQLRKRIALDKNLMDYTGLPNAQ